MDVLDGGSNPYVLGHGSHELERLIKQGRFFNGLSAHLLREAGLAPGMRVLDVGCGAGDLSFVAAGLVGPAGHVTGIDRGEDAIATATARAASAGLTNVHFIPADAATFTPVASYDAIIGRLVLMYFPQPGAILRRLATLARPGGLLTFQEFDLEAVRADPECPLYTTTMIQMRETFVRTGADVRMGLKLGRVYEDAGLPEPEMLATARIERGSHLTACDQIAGVMRSLLPAIERTGVATAGEIGIDTLADRLRQDALSRGATLVSPTLIGAWAQVAAA